jgi:pentachlorophenol monooxygenase/3-(3-hydroxy-phenyl)propionate hydroxylase
VVGAGPVGLTLAGRLAQQGVRVAIFDAAPAHIGEGSKALCMQRETLDIWGRLGVGERVAERGVQWRIGRTYFRDRELFSVTLPNAGSDHFPPFVNISQTEVERLLLDRLGELGVAVSWGRRLTSVRQQTDEVELAFEDGSVEQAGYAVGADGAHSAVRHAIGLSFDGHTFEDRFLIADVRADLPFPHERRFYFDPPWNPGRQVLIHPQPDEVWRIDWQVPPETDAGVELASGGLDRRIRAVIGPQAPYELVWLTGYRFSQRLAERFRVGRVFLAGDAAHVMSPFGARGLNSGVGDAEDLAAKLGAVLRGEAGDALLDTYDGERRAVAAENLAVTDATMRFMVPHGPWRRAWRDLILRLSPHAAWARRRVNSGRLAEPSHPGRIHPA